MSQKAPGQGHDTGTEPSTEATTPSSTAPNERWQDAEELRWAARHWATRLGVKAPRIQLRPMTSKWASISTAGRLTLNTDLLDVPKALGEFVIVHELVHLLAPNHGRVFTSFLHAYLPDWQARERALRRYASNDSVHGCRSAKFKQRPTP
jgi:predicted metal-dependent hydrolase